MKRIIGILVCLFALAPFAYAAYSMKVTVTMPTGSEGATTSTTKPSNTKLSPCDNSTIPDAVTLTLAYNAGSNTVALPNLDTFIIFFNPDNATAYKYYMLKRNTFPSTTVTIVPVTTLDNSTRGNIYLPRANYSSTTITETLMGGSLFISGAPSGVWQAVGIVADNATLNFDDTTTWKAWDVGTFMIKKPWYGTANQTCL